MSLSRYIILASLCGVFVLISQRTEAQSFDCKRASTVVEKAICNDASASEFDQQLADAFKKVLDRHPEWKTKLLLTERHWLQYREAQCKGFAGEPGKMDDCLRDLYSRRLAVIESDNPLAEPVGTAASADTTTQPSQAVPVLSTASQNLRSAWFLPSLTTNQDPICPAVLAGARRGFATPVSPHGPTPSVTYQGLKAVDGFFAPRSDSNSSVQVVPGQPNVIEFRLAHDDRLYVKQVTNEFCGGACETQQLLLSKSPAHFPAPDTAGTASTPQSDGYGWGIYETPEGKQYVIGGNDQQLEVYSPAQPASWRLSCRIALTPGNLKDNANADVQRAAASIAALRAAVERIAGTDGYSCGTLQTAGRWRIDFANALAEVLYRPWAVPVRQTDPQSANSYGDYNRIYPGLQEWSLGGIVERRAFEDYRAQLQSTTREVAAFYGRLFHWPDERASATAGQTVVEAVSHRFGFYLYDPYPDPREAELREAILDRKPLTEIEAIPLDIHYLDRPAADSILNIALEYPEAMAYLLRKGANPNLPNAFGKTPLMYAAQDNQMEAVKLLLQAGADPNAATTVPSDGCYYALQRHGVTALHYAVKYADKAVIQELLDGGAATFVRTARYIGASRGSYPVDWLDGSNAKLSPDDMRALKSELAVASDADRSRSSIVLSAEAAQKSATGDPTGAYRTIKLALLADPENSRAISDFPLLALKIGAIGPALEGAARELNEAKTPGERAAAHFNEGLACRRTTAPIPTYNNQRYCQGGYFEQFIQAWQIEPTSGRSSKIIHLFDTAGPHDCVVADPGGRSTKYRILQVFDQRASASERVYALHVSSVTIDPSAIEWHESYIREPDVTKTRPHLVETLQLDKDHSLTVLEDPYIPDHVSIQGRTCF